MGYFLSLLVTSVKHILYYVLPFILGSVILAVLEGTRAAFGLNIEVLYRRWLIRDTLDSRHHDSKGDKEVTPTRLGVLKTSTDGQEKTPFIYTPLPAGTHTRLITLLPSDGASPIECLLDTTDLSKQPKYEALSYVWGEVDVVYGILLNGQPFPVGLPLWLALSRLRHKIKPQTLWIDAISINQKDDAEKAIQIRQMGKIYSQASTVLAWLGDQRNEHIDDASTVMEILCKNIPPRARRDWRLFYLGGEGATVREAPPLALIETCANFVKIAVAVLRAHPISPLSMRLIFSDCPYWSRLWIIQEVLLAKNLVLCCGTKRFPWTIYSDLRPLMQYLLNLSHIQPKLREGINWREIYTAFGVDRAAKFDKLRREHIIDGDTQQDYDLRPLLNMSLAAQCLKPRDRIYGCLGVISVPYMPVDYNRSMSDVFTDTLQHITCSSVRGVGPLYDFYTVRFAQLVQVLLKGPFTDARERSPLFRICGFQTGVIESVGTTCTIDDDFNIIKAKLEHLFRNYPSATRGIPFTRDPFDILGQYARLEALGHAREHNLIPPHKISPIITKTISIYESKCMNAIYPWNAAYCEAITRPYSIDDMVQEDSSLDIPSESPIIDTTQSPTIVPPKIFLTTSLGFGLCPESSLPGDIVVQFLNSDTAAILRPSVDLERGTQYHFIGRAFVGRDGGVDATMKIIGTPSNDSLRKHGSIMTEEEVVKRGLTSCVEMVVDSETLQHLTARLDLRTGGLRSSEITFDDFMQR